MSQYPTCPKHGLLKPCIHCEPPKYVEEIELCSDSYKGNKLVKCECGKYRPAWRRHGEQIRY